MDNEELKWKKRFERERSSRKEAEKLLENKSRELFDLNLSLKDRIEEEITKNRKKEEFLAEQSRFTSMNEILGNIAHQWRQPLSAISSGASGAQLQMQLNILSDQELDEILASIVERATYLSTTIDEFRNFFKRDSEVTIFTIEDIFNNINNIIKGSFRNENITLIKDIEKDLNCKGVQSELTQVVLNILNNAKDILSELNSHDKVVKFEAYKKDDHIIINIYDNAKGVPEDILPKIFEPYFTTKHQSQGTGIGLYMSKQLLLNHFKGMIGAENKTFKVENKVYFGACFSISFPINL